MILTHLSGRTGSLGLLALLFTGGVTAACGSGTPPSPGGGAEAGNLIELRLDKSDPERLLRYYMAAYTGAELRDPIAAGLVVGEGARFALDRDTLAALQPVAAGRLSDADGDGVLNWDELAAFLQETYYDARGVAATLEAFQAAYPYQDSSEAWFTVEVDGVMTTARRRIHVPRPALRAALASYTEHQRQLLYPEGTAIVGEHVAEGEIAETTVMQKRADGYWDFMVYDAEGDLASRTLDAPRALKAPTQCVGCHFGSKLFEPEKSFPGEAAPGPFGPRAIHVTPALRDAEVAAFFDEHARRSDTVLGLYGTLFVAQLRADRRSGSLAPEDAELLNSLGL